jgi:hypothetical protein
MAVSRYTRTFFASVLALMVAVQMLSPGAGSLSGSQLALIHAEFHKEHNAHHDGAAAYQQDHHSFLELKIHADLSSTLFGGALLASVPHVFGEKASPVIPPQLTPHHKNPSPGVDTPPPIA